MCTEFMSLTKNTKILKIHSKLMCNSCVFNSKQLPFPCKLRQMAGTLWQKQVGPGRRPLQKMFMTSTGKVDAQQSQIVINKQLGLFQQ